MAPDHAERWPVIPSQRRISFPQPVAIHFPSGLNRGARWSPSVRAESGELRPARCASQRRNVRSSLLEATAVPHLDCTCARSIQLPDGRRGAFGQQLAGRHVPYADGMVSRTRLRDVSRPGLYTIHIPRCLWSTPVGRLLRARSSFIPNADPEDRCRTPPRLRSRAGLATNSRLSNHVSEAGMNQPCLLSWLCRVPPLPVAILRGAASRAARARPMYSTAAPRPPPCRSVARQRSRSVARSALPRSFGGRPRQPEVVRGEARKRGAGEEQDAAMTASAAARLLLRRDQRSRRSGSQGRRALIGWSSMKQSKSSPDCRAV